MTPNLATLLLPDGVHCTQAGNQLVRHLVTQVKVPELALDSSSNNSPSLAPPWGAA
jgi:hypothetical protein